MPDKLEICIGNSPVGIMSILQIIREEFPSIQVKEWGCLGNCHNCFRKPFVLLNDTTLVQGEDADDLLDQLRRALSS